MTRGNYYRISLVNLKFMMRILSVVPEREVLSRTMLSTQRAIVKKLLGFVNMYKRVQGNF